MTFWKKNDGITLVELLVSIAIGATILLAASMVLLLGLRVNHQTTEAVTRQYTARTVLTLMENLATEGKIERIEHYDDGSWEIGNFPEGADKINVILSYNADQKAILTGAIQSGTRMLENIVASYVLMEENNVLTVAIEDTEQTYTSSVYCRTNQVAGNTDFDAELDKLPANNSEQRAHFLRVLASQVGYRGGIIHHDQHPLNDHFCGAYNFFSEWYIGGFDANAKVQGWNENTPWCACFVSWGLYGVFKDHADITSHLNEDERPNPLLPQGEEQKEGNTKVKKWFANVDDFMAYFAEAQLAYNQHKAENEDVPDYAIWTSKEAEPEPGDLIFFNTINDDETNPSHMGAVLKVEDIKKDINGKIIDGYVYTIEGNSADMVAVRKYHMNDSDIIGYGDPWAAQAAAEVMSPKPES